MLHSVSDSIPNKIFFDISSLVDYVERIDRYSGIQRVASMVIAEAAERVGPEFLYLSYVDKMSGKHRCVAFAEVGADILKSPMRMRQLFFGRHGRRTPLRPLRRYQGNALKFHFHRIKLDVLSVLGYDRAFVRYNMTARVWRKLRFPKGSQDKTRALNPRLVSQEASSGDKLVLLDSTWRDRHTCAFQSAKRSGLIVHVLVHDLIPLVAPGMTDGAAPGVFYKWLRSTFDYSDVYIANSEATRRDLLQFLKDHGVNRDIPVLPLAQTDIPIVDEGDEDPPGPLQLEISKETYPALYEIVGIDGRIRSLLTAPYVLCVGTIEARKNVWRLSVAWKHLLSNGMVDLPRLVFAGRRGSLSTQFFDFLDSTGGLHGYITVVDGPSDWELQFLYKNCLFAAMPSLYEGWGLPVGEALSYGKTAVVSNTSSLPEVGGDLVEYCDPHSVKSIADAVMRLVADPARREALEEKIRQAKLRSWADVADDLLAIIGVREGAKLGQPVVTVRDEDSEVRLGAEAGRG